MHDGDGMSVGRPMMLLQETREGKKCLFDGPFFNLKEDFRSTNVAQSPLSSLQSSSLAFFFFWGGKIGRKRERESSVVKNFVNCQMPN